MRVLLFRPPRARPAARFGLSIAVGVTLLAVGPTARAEFKVGGKLPEFSLKAPDAGAVTLGRKGERVTISRATTTVQPKVLVLHLFQPDCLQCQAQMQELEKLYRQFRKEGVLVVGIAHRGDPQAVRAVTQRLHVTFPVAVGTGSDFAKKFAAGDSLAIADESGVVRFAQVGYGAGDEKVWREDIEQLLAGKPVAQETIARKRLQMGDRLPVIELPSVTTGKTITLSGEGGQLTFRDDAGQIVHPRAAVGFFSRY